jgi:hypothetical protein
MTAATMEEWLSMFNAKMKKGNRNVILFLDNATCHPKVTLSNVKIAWFPANAISGLQHIDMGVIYTFKSHYRRFLMQSLILNVDINSSYALARSVLVLDAVNWIGLAVKKFEEETVKKCFAKAGFGENGVADNLEEASENSAAIPNLFRGKELSYDTKDFVWSVDHLATHYTFESVTALLAVRNTQNDMENEEEEGGEAAGEQFRKRTMPDSSHKVRRFLE